MSSDLRQLLREAEAAGWEVRKRKHLKLTHPEAATPVFLAATPSDHRSLANARATLRRALPREPVEVERRTLPAKARPVKARRPKPPPPDPVTQESARPVQVIDSDGLPLRPRRSGRSPGAPAMGRPSAWKRAT